MKKACSYCIGMKCNLLNECIENNHAHEGGQDYEEIVDECIYSHYAKLVYEEGYTPEEAKKQIDEITRNQI